MSGNKWALLTTALALAGLGFAAMSTNPPFYIPSWVPIVFFVLAGISFIWLIILFLKGKINKKQIEIRELQPKITISAKVIDNPVLSLAQSISLSPRLGEKLKTIEVGLQISKPIVLNKLSLEIWGQKFDTAEFGGILSLRENTIVERSDCFRLAFFIPDNYAISCPDATIYTMADNLEYRSTPFALDFGVIK